MSTEVVTTGSKKNGEITVRHKDRFKADVAALRDGELIFIVRRAHATRTAAANAYYWSVVIEFLSRRIKDMTPNEIHEHVLKPMFLPKKGAALDGNGTIVAEWVVGGSTSKLNVNEFYEYCESIRQWAAETLDLDIPDPDPNWKEKRDAEAACQKCGELVPASSLVDVEREWSDGGRSGVDVIKACPGCVPDDMRRAG